MRAEAHGRALAVALALLAGCDPPPKPAAGTPEAVLAHCGAYGGDVRGYCLAHFAPVLRDPESVDAVCGAAEGWEGECRMAWAEAKLEDREVPTRALLAACGTASDCAFLVLDHRPEGDVLAQMAACERHAPAFAADCAGHALRRWLDERPDGHELARIAIAASTQRDRVGQAIGWVVACRGEGTCGETPGPLDRACRAARDEARGDPKRCADARTR